MATYIRKNNDPSAWDAQKQNYDNFVNSIINAGEKIGDEDQREKEFFLKLADKGIELDDEAQTNLSRISKYFNGLGNWKKQKDENAAPEATKETAPSDDISKVMSELKKIDPEKNVMDQPKEQKKKLDLVKIASILDSGDYSKLKEEYPDEFNNMDVNEQENFLKNFSAGDESKIQQQAPQEIPPIPGMGELRAFDAGKINQVPSYEKMPEMDVLNVEGIAPKNAIPPIPPIAQAPQEQAQGDEYGSGYLGSLARYSKNVRDTKGYAALTQRLNALKNSYGNVKDAATARKIEAETAKIMQEIEDRNKPWEKSREGQKALFGRETNWQDPKNMSLADLYKERMKNLKSGKGENPLEAQKFEFQKDKEARAIANDINRIAEPLKNIDFELSKMESLVGNSKERDRMKMNQSPANDYALIFSYLKMLDQRSIVRETEYETAQKLDILKNKIPGIIEKLDSGGSLTQTQRQMFLDTARIYAREGYAANKSGFDNYRSLIKKNNLAVDIPTFKKLDSLLQDKGTNQTVIDSANRILNDKNAGPELKRKARKALEKVLR